MNFSNKIGLGSVQFGMDYGISNFNGITPNNEVEKLLLFSKNAGINTIDTAASYGTSEEVLGRFKLADFKIVSKFMPPNEDLTIENQFLTSLKKLRVEKIYGYLAHRPEDLISRPEQWDALKRLKDNGQVDKIGFSLNRTTELKQLIDLDCFPDLVQVPFNYLDTRFKENIIKLREKGCEIHTRSSYLQGLFFLDTNKLHHSFEPIKCTILSLQNEYKEDLPKVLLKYVLLKDYIDKVIVGVENTSQLIQNIQNLSAVKNLEDLNLQFSESILMPSLWPKKCLI